MLDPERLMRHGATTRELELLRAGDAEEPPHDGVERVRRSLGLEVGLEEGPRIPRSAGGAARANPRWWLLGAAAALVSGGALAGLALSRAGVLSPTPSTRSSAAEPRRSEEGVLPRGAGDGHGRATGGEAPGSIAEPDEHKELALPRRARKNEGPPLAASSSIALEVQLLDEVRGLLGARRPAMALSALDRFGERFPGGALRQEATLLRIEALTAAGNLPDARARGERFLRDNPTSPHANRVRSLVGDGP